TSRPFEPMRQQRGPDALAAMSRIDAEGVQPGFLFPDERQLRDPDEVAFVDRDPEPTAPVAHPFVELIGDVVAAPDPCAKRADRTFVPRLRGTDTEGPAAVHGASWCWVRSRERA